MCAKINAFMKQAKNGDEIIDEVKAVVLNWKRYAGQCGVSNASKNEIGRILGAR